MTQQENGAAPGIGEFFVPPLVEANTPETRREFLRHDLWPVFGTSDVNCISFLMIEPRGDEYRTPYYTSCIASDFSVVQGEQLVYRPDDRFFANLFREEFSERLGTVITGEGHHRNANAFVKQNRPETVTAEAFAAAVLMFSHETGMSAREVFGAEKNTTVSFARYTVLQTLAHDSHGEVVSSEPAFSELGLSKENVELLLRRFVDIGVLSKHEIPVKRYRVGDTSRAGTLRGQLQRDVVRALPKPKDGIRPTTTVEHILRDLQRTKPERYGPYSESSLRTSISNFFEQHLLEDEVVTRPKHITDYPRKHFITGRTKYYYTFAEDKREAFESAVQRLESAQRAIVAGDHTTIEALREAGRAIIASPANMKHIIARHAAMLGECVRLGSKPQEVDPRKSVILRILGDQTLKAAEIAAKTDMTQTQVSALLGALAKEGQVEAAPTQHKRAKIWKAR